MQAAEKYRLSKLAVANSFAQAANSYDKYAVLQRDVADHLLNNIVVKNEPKTILDLGCGTGYCTEKLKLKFPKATIISLDIAQGMLRQASNKMLVSGVCADAESLPFMSNSFDLIVSSLTIQWCKNCPALFSELNRALNNSGSFYLSTFGPNTLQELKKAWALVDGYVHVNQFFDKESLLEFAKENLRLDIFLEEQSLVKYYDSLIELSSELKYIGAHNMNQGQAKGLSGRSKIAQLKKAFESNFEFNKGIPVTYLLYYLSFQKSC